MSAVIAAAAMGTVALVAVPAAASATAARTAPTITSVEVNPSTIVVTGNGKVSASFGFVTENAATAAEAYIKPPGQSVETKLDLATADLGSGKAKWTASRDFDGTAAAGTWNLRVTAKNADGDKTDNKGFEVRQVRTTNFDDFGASPSNVNQGDDVTLAGRLVVDDGGWKALGGAKVYIAFRPLGGSWSRVTSTNTNGQGKFWVKAKTDRTGWWRAEYDATAVTTSATSDSDRVDVKTRPQVRDSRITGFGASPNPIDQGDRLSVEGVLQVEGDGGWRGFGRQKVDILFKAEGSHSWRRVASDWTDRHGRFGADFTADTSGWWRAEFGGADGVAGSSSNADWVNVNQPAPPAQADTRLIRFNAYPEPVRYGHYVKFGGALQVWDGDHWAAYSGQKLGLFFKAAGSRKWEYVKTLGTGGQGRFFGKVKDWHSGWWKVSFRGNGEALGSSGRPDYVKVKK